MGLQWAATNLVTMVFTSDDYWVYERFKQLATRMEVISVDELPKAQAVAALRNYRRRYFAENVPTRMLEQVYDRVGGRLNFLNRVAKSHNMLETCEEIKQIEKTWFLNQCWILGSEMDDDVMDQQKWAVSTSLGLLRASPPAAICLVSWDTSPATGTRCCWVFTGVEITANENAVGSHGTCVGPCRQRGGDGNDLRRGGRALPSLVPIA